MRRNLQEFAAVSATDTVSAPAPSSPPSAGSSDHSSFVCHGAPGLWLLSKSWDYGTYTWHTTRDTYDKVVFSDLQRNAVLLAMMAYLASEDPQRVPRTMRTDLPGTPAASPAAGPSASRRSGRSIELLRGWCEPP